MAIFFFGRITDRLIALLLTMSVFAISQDKPVSDQELFEMSLQDIMNVQVLSVSHFDTPLIKTPGYTMVIKQDKIGSGPARTLHDILNMYIPGNIVGYHGFHGSLHGVRGILIDNNAKTTVHLEDHNLNQRTHFGYTVGMLSPLLGDIDRIEITNGPGSITQGSGAINGFINMIAKTGSKHPGLLCSGEYGTKEAGYRLQAGYGHQFGLDKDLFLYAGIYNADGYTPQNLLGQIPAYPVKSYGFGETGYRLSATWNHKALHFNAFVFENNPNKGSAMTGKSNLQGYFHNLTAGFQSKYSLRFNSTDRLDILGSLAWFDFYENEKGRGWENDTLKLAGGSEQHTEFQAILKTTRFSHHNLALGALAGSKFFNPEQLYFGSDDLETLEILDTEWQEFSVFLEDRWQMAQSLTLTSGLRLDKVKTHPFYGDALPRPMSRAIDSHISPQVTIWQVS